MSSIEMASNTTVLVSAVGVREQLGHASLTVQARLRGRGPDVVLVLLGGRGCAVDSGLGRQRVRFARNLFWQIVRHFSTAIV